MSDPQPDLGSAQSLATQSPEPPTHVSRDTPMYGITVTRPRVGTRWVAVEPADPAKGAEAKPALVYIEGPGGAAAFQRKTALQIAQRVGGQLRRIDPTRL